MQKHVNLVDLVKSFPTNIYLQNLASIQPRTSLSKFARDQQKVDMLQRKYMQKNVEKQKYRAHGVHRSCAAASVSSRYELLFFRCRGTLCLFCLRRHFLYIGINGTYRFRLRQAPFSGLHWPFPRSFTSFLLSSVSSM